MRFLYLYCCLSLWGIQAISAQQLFERVIMAPNVSLQDKHWICFKNDSQNWWVGDLISGTKRTLAVGVIHTDSGLLDQVSELSLETMNLQAVAIAPMGNGGILITAQVFTNQLPIKYNSFLICIDGNGKVLWSKQLQDRIEPYQLKAIPVDNHSIWLAYTLQGEPHDFMLQALTETGKVKWVRFGYNNSFAGSSENRLRDMIADQHGGVYALIENTKEEGKLKSGIVHFNSTGHIIRAINLEYPNETHTLPGTIFGLDSGKFLVTVHYTESMQVICLDSQLNVQWTTFPAYVGIHPVADAIAFDAKDLTWYWIKETTKGDEGYKTIQLARFVKDSMINSMVIDQGLAVLSCQSQSFTINDQFVIFAFSELLEATQEYLLNIRKMKLGLQGCTNRPQGFLLPDKKVPIITPYAVMVLDNKPAYTFFETLLNSRPVPMQTLRYAGCPFYPCRSGLQLPDTVFMCGHKPVEFDIQGYKQYHFRWTNGDTSSHIYFSGSGKIALTLFPKDSFNCDTLSDSVWIQRTILDPLTINDHADEIWPGKSMMLNIQPHAIFDSIRWNSSNGLTDVKPYFSLSSELNDTIEVKVRAFKNNCSVSDSTWVRINGYSIYVPNAFTPNGDGINDVFCPKARGILECEMQIFNQWGQLVFRGTNACWEGNDFRNAHAPQGVYLAKITCTDDRYRRQELNQWITLLR